MFLNEKQTARQGAKSGSIYGHFLPEATQALLQL